MPLVTKVWRVGSRSALCASFVRGRCLDDNYHGVIRPGKIIGVFSVEAGYPALFSCLFQLVWTPFCIFPEDTLGVHSWVLVE